MKYLKTFESVDKKSYWEISVGEVCLGIYGDSDATEEESIFKKNNWEEFTQDEISKIKETIPNSSNQIKHTVKIPYPGSLRGKNNIGIDSSTREYVDGMKLEIFKIIDEWYYVEMRRWRPNQTALAKWYRCDQLDGLLDCLRYLYEIE